MSHLLTFALWHNQHPELPAWANVYPVSPLLTKDWPADLDIQLSSTPGRDAADLTSWVNTINTTAITAQSYGDPGRGTVHIRAYGVISGTRVRVWGSVPDGAWYLGLPDTAEREIPRAVLAELVENEAETQKHRHHQAVAA